MKWSRSIIPSMVAFAALASFLPRSGPSIKLNARDFSFSSANLHVRTGDSILITNVGKSTHTFTCPDCRADSENIQPGQSATVKLGRAGTFAFYCIYHQREGMSGKVTVSG